MALKLRRGKTSSFGKILTTSIVVLAVAIQPMHGLIQPQGANALASSEVVYDSLPSTTPDTNYPSYGAQAHSFNQVGDRIVLAGTNRTLSKVTVTMSDWALKATPANVAWCNNNPGKCSDAGFLYPVTLNVYASDLTLITTTTQEVLIPWRPAGDPSCGSTSNGTNKGWLKDGACYNFGGIAFNAEFNLSASQPTVPSDIILGISYDTQTRGAAPTGVDGPFNSLNVTLPGSPVTTGTDYDNKWAYVETPLPSYWGVGSTAFQPVEMGAGYGLAFRVEATQLAAPTILAPSPASGAYTTNPSFDMEFTKVAGATKYEYETTYGTGGYYHDTSDSSNYDVSGSTVVRHNHNSPEATYKWHVRAIDAYGNIGAWSDYAYVTVDATTPAAPSDLTWVDSSNNGPQNGYTRTQKGTLSWKDTTPSDVDHYVYKFWTNIPGYQDNPNNPWSDSYTYVVKTSDGGHVPTDFADKEGTYFFCVEAVDAAGNISTCTQTSVTYDKTAPTVSGISVDRTPTNANQLVVKGTVSDANLKNYNLRVYKADKSAQVSPGIAFTGTTSVTDSTVGTLNISGLANGDYWVRVWADDAAGNRTGISSQIFVPFTVDRTGPVGTVSYAPSGWTNGSVTATISTSEPVSTPSGWTPVSATEFTKEFTANATENVDITDAAGNVSTVTVVVDKIDTVLPFFNIANGSLFNTSSVQVVVTEANLATVTVNGQPVSFTGTRSVHSMFVPGDGVRTVVATDAAGNQRTVTFMIDSTKPVLGVTSTDRNTDGSYTVIGTSDDTANVLVSVDGSLPIVVGVSNGQWTLTTDILPTGNHTIDATSTDEAGNVGATTHTFLAQNAQAFTAPVVALGDQAVLGDQNVNASDKSSRGNISDQDVKGTSDVKNTTFSPLGLAWYWWLLVLAAVAGLWWLIAGLRRRSQDEN